MNTDDTEHTELHSFFVICYVVKKIKHIAT
jgi:hypothetical protein